MTLATRSEFIDLLKDQYGRKVNRSTVHRWIEKGRVAEIDGKIDVEKSIELLNLTAGAREDVSRRHREEAKEKGGAPAGDDKTGTLVAFREKRAEADTRRAIAQADREEMERDQLAGNLVPREEVAFAFDDLGATLRSLMDNFADRITPIVHPLQTFEERHAANAEFAQEVLQTMHDRMIRIAESRKAE